MDMYRELELGRRKGGRRKGEGGRQEKEGRDEGDCFLYL